MTATSAFALPTASTVRVAHTFPTSTGKAGLRRQPQSVSFVCTHGDQTFTVPAGVASIVVDAVGAPGANGADTGGSTGGAGGNGGTVTGAGLTVTPGQVLHVEVGCAGSSTGAGGFNGGGSGGSGAADITNPGGGGGGATSLQTADNSGCVLSGNPTTDCRLLVAAGGGGGGSINNPTAVRRPEGHPAAGDRRRPRARAARLRAPRP
ncbi:hypothetical protein ABZ646_41625, partial [Streptomyces sp. NPDC007162]